MISTITSWAIDILYFAIVATVMLMGYQHVTNQNITIDLVSGVLLGAAIAALVRELKSNPIIVITTKGESNDKDTENPEYLNKG